MNAALALATVRLLNDQIPVPPPAIRRGLESVSWPGRLQLEKTVWGQAILLDGAHNPAGAGVLRAALRTEFPHANPSLVLGILRDKDWATMCRILAPLAPRLFLVPVHSQRTAMPEMLLSICREANPVAEVFVCDSLAQALQWAAPDPFLVVTGSLYLVGEALEQLRLAPASAAGERGLNEWWSLGAEALAAPRCR